MDAAAAEELGAAVVHRCKGFHRGRSLGGHMRSHVSLGEVASAAYRVDAGDEVKRAPSSGAGGAVGYGLRGNPKKKRRLSDFASEEGGGDGGGHRACRECGKLFSSWKSLIRHMRRHASGGDDADLVEGPFSSEEEMPTPVAVMAEPPRRRRRSMRVAAPAPAPAPRPLLSGFEKEPEDVAICLLMLSRDTALWSSPEREKTTAKQTHGYAYNSDYDSAMFQYGDATIKSGGGGGGIKSKKRALSSTSPKQQCEVAPPAKRSRYECPGCGRVFSSYQALGGHRASHKRINSSCSAPRATAAAAPTPEPSVESRAASFTALSPSASPDSVATAKKPAAAVKFEFPVCFRAFASGQALGGHKLSHVMAAAAAACSDDVELYGSDSSIAELEQGHLDLNFPPAPSEEA